MNPMLEAFIGESRDLLEVASQCFLDLEKAPNDQAIFNELFRAVHTIKGASGIFEIEPFTKVVHAAEDILDLVKVGKLVLTPDHIDLLLDCFDQVAVWLDDLESSSELSAQAPEISAGMTKQLRALLSEVNGDSNQGTSAEDIATLESNVEAAEPPSIPLPTWFETVPVSAKLNAAESLQANEDAQLFCLSYSAPHDCYFTGQDPLNEVESTEGLVWFTCKTIEDWPPKDADFDPFKHNLAFQGLVASAKDTLYDHFRHVAECIEVIPLTLEDCVSVVGEMGESDTYKLFVDDAPGLLQAQDWPAMVSLAQSILSFANPAHYQSVGLQWVVRVCQQSSVDSGLVAALIDTVKGEPLNYDSHGVTASEHLNKPQATPSDKAVGSESAPNAVASSGPNSTEQKHIRALLDAQLASLTLPIDANLWQGRATSIAQVLKRVVHWCNLSHPSDFDIEQALTHAVESKDAGALHELISDVEKLLEGNLIQTDSNAIQEPIVDAVAASETAPAQSAAPVSKDTATRKSTSKVLRVDQGRIDAMMDLVGELVVAKNALPFLARRAEQEFHCRELSREIRSQYAIINRLAEEMQNAVMQVRMVPVNTVFQRFPRLVRDLSRKLGKSIELVMIGEDTEADKTVVEDLADPLIHIVRNSIDHGIEMPDVRKQTAKPEVATITLKAVQMDDQVLIEIHDDGKGIDPEVIKRKALEKGVIDETTHDSISDKDALQLIFAPGFSTAEQISDLSGRGVGMDVVRTTIENAGGKVNVDSTLGEGTRIVLSLPLSMAVSQVMMIRCDQQSYGVSYDSIVETVRIPKTAISRIKNRQTIVLRDRIIPLFYLRELLSLPVHTNGIDEYGQAVLIVEIDGEETGIVVDDFQEGTDLILKPLEGIMAQCPYYSGTALLGDGRVLMVINLKELTTCQYH